MRFAIMESSDRGVDFVRTTDYMIANFSYRDAKKVMDKLNWLTGNMYSAIAIESDFCEPTMAADASMY